MNNVIDENGFIVPDTRSFQERKIANRNWMRAKRLKGEEKRRQTRLLSQGKCPTCEILLTSKYHFGCTHSKSTKH